MLLSELRNVNFGMLNFGMNFGMLNFGMLFNFKHRQCCPQNCACYTNEEASLRRQIQVLSNGLRLPYPASCGLQLEPCLDLMAPETVCLVMQTFYKSTLNEAFIIRQIVNAVVVSKNLLPPVKCKG